jgi:hypothetical protein
MKDKRWEKVPLTPAQKLHYRALIEYGVRNKETVENPFHYMAFDPGKVTGFATFAENGMPVEMGHIPDWNVGVARFVNTPVFKSNPPKVVICEAYQIRGRGQTVNSDAIRTRSVISIIKNFAAASEARLIMQQASILPIAAKFSGMEMPRDHSLSHQISAFNHGWYRLTEDKVVVPRIMWPEG